MANPVVHFEVVGKDGKKLQDFYGGVFGWNINAENPMNYGLVSNEDTGGGIGGGVAQSDNPAVTFYIEVDDPEAYLKKVDAAGGKTIMPVTEIPGMVIMAMFGDPEGNAVGLVKAGYPG